MIRTIEGLLSDIDIAFNTMDEPRLAVPWERINELMEIERNNKTMADAKDVIVMFEKRPLPENMDPEVESEKG